MNAHRKGVAFLLMIVLLAVFLSIAIGIINILLGQVFIVGKAGDSFKALYAADIGMERVLYRDRHPLQNVCGTTSCDESKSFTDGACYTTVVKIGPSVDCASPSTRCIVVSGQSTCVPATRYVERSFDIKY